jgi:rare lipoprotein A
MLKYWAIFCFFLINSTASANYDKKLYGVEKVGGPYVIEGKKYYPKFYNSLDEEGFISWYGPGFHAKTTANGATFNQNTYTVAHRTLQMPSVIEITNIKNGKKVIAVVNDRGPFSKTQHRILDVSKQTAKDLDFLEEGVVKGRVRLLKRETDAFLAGKKIKLGPVSSSYRGSSEAHSKPIAQPSAREGKVAYSQNATAGNFIQVGSFRSYSNAKRVAQDIKEQGVKDVLIVKNEEHYVVRVGSVEKNNVQKVLTKLQRMGYDNSEVLIID